MSRPNTRPYRRGPVGPCLKAKLEEEYGDPAAESQAQEFLLTYKQGKKKPREFLNELELWFRLANVTEDGHKLRAATRAMGPVHGRIPYL